MKSLWLMLIGALSLVIAVEWFLPVQEPLVPSYSKPAKAGINQVNLLAKADLTTDFPAMEQYQSVKDRPLFFEGRRPPDEQASEAPKAKPEKPTGKVSPSGVSLSAVVRVGDNTYAMLKGVGKEKGLARVKVGGDVGGWKVESIHDDRVVLNNGMKKHEIPLRSYKAIPLPKSTPAVDKARARKKALAARRAGRKKEQK